MRLSVVKAFAVGLIMSVATSAKAQDCVVLLHGLARTDASLALMETVLTSKGYRVINQGYPSTSEPIEWLVGQAIPPALKACGDARVHFVTHSLGGILVRAYLGDTNPDWLGHVVMLAPPNKGSEVVDQIGDTAVFKWRHGPAGNQLGTGGTSVPNQLGPVKYSVGIIAGNVPLGAIGAVVMDGPNDGKVSVESTKLEGMAAHLTLPVSHTFLMNNPVVIAQTLGFLGSGKFTGGMTVGDALKIIDPVDMVNTK